MTSPANNEDPEFAALEQMIRKQTDEHNRTPVADFEGLSPEEMFRLLYEFPAGDASVQLVNHPDAITEIPIVQQVLYLLTLAAESKGIKLTPKNNLPPAVVKDLYNKGWLKEDFIEKGITKLTKEKDANTIVLTRLLCELSGLAKSRKGVFSLTKNGEKILKDSSSLFPLIFHTFTGKFNWGFFDGYKSEQAALFGFGFSIYLICKYGKSRRLVEFYAEKYFQAFPDLEKEFTKYEYGNHSYNCFITRTFDRFLDYFGFIRIEYEKKDNGMGRDTFITATPLVYKYFRLNLG